MTQENLLFLLPGLLVVVVLAIDLWRGRSHASGSEQMVDDEFADAPGHTGTALNELNLDYTQPFFAADGAHQDLVNLPRTPGQ